MAISDTILRPDVEVFVDQARGEAELAFQVFRDTDTISANGTANIVERVPDDDKLVVLNYPGPWAADQTVHPVVVGFDGTVLLGSGPAGWGATQAKLFERRPEITTSVHIHTPYLGAWAQTHRSYPIRYAASARLTLSREVPPHIDRRQPAADFILERLDADPHLAAVFEANGGANVLGRQGLLETAKFIVLLEEGAKFQALAESLGGSKEFGPGNLEGQWRMSGLLDQARAEGLLPPDPEE